MTQLRLVTPDWRDQAECRFDPDVWFEKEHEAEAVFICQATCTVRDQCLADALANGEPFGIRAGFTPDELAELPGFAASQSVARFVPEPDELRHAKFARIDGRKRGNPVVPDPLADLDHPADRKTTQL